MLMRLLCGLIRPSEGEIFYDEKKWGQIFVFRQALESFLENPSFLDSYTGLQNLKMIADNQSKNYGKGKNKKYSFPGRA